MKKLNKEQTIAVVNAMLTFAENQNKPFDSGYPDKATLKRWYALKRRQWQQEKEEGKSTDGRMFIGGKMFLLTSRDGVKGAVVVPEDGSYLRFIANSWYDHQLTF